MIFHVPDPCCLEIFSNATGCRKDRTLRSYQWLFVRVPEERTGTEFASVRGFDSVAISVLVYHGRISRNSGS
jgi:hypothetical protein